MTFIFNSSCFLRWPNNAAESQENYNNIRTDRRSLFWETSNMMSIFKARLTNPINIWDLSCIHRSINLRVMHCACEREQRNPILCPWNPSPLILISFFLKECWGWKTAILSSLIIFRAWKQSQKTRHDHEKIGLIGSIFVLDKSPPGEWE